MRLIRLLSIIVLAGITLQAANRFIPLRIGDYSMLVEVAEEDESRIRGLQRRTALARDYGMLFVFPDEVLRYFWMKEVEVRLDIIYLDRSKRVINIRHSVPPCRNEPCPVYPSGAPAMYVLELAGGRARELGLETGQRIFFNL